MMGRWLVAGNGIKAKVMLVCRAKALRDVVWTQAHIPFHSDNGGHLVKIVVSQDGRALVPKSPLTWKLLRRVSWPGIYPHFEHDKYIFIVLAYPDFAKTLSSAVTSCNPIFKFPTHGFKLQ